MQNLEFWVPAGDCWSQGLDHRPRSRQVTHCTEVAACQSWAECSSRPTTDSRHQGWAIKYFFALSEMLTICEQPLYGIVLMILHINESCVLIRDQNSQILYSPLKTSPMLRDTRAAFSLPAEHARHDTTDLRWARTCWMVMGQWFRPQWIPYMARVTQHLLTCGEKVTKIWSIDLHCADVWSLAEVKRLCECPEEWIS